MRALNRSSKPADEIGLSSAGIHQATRDFNVRRRYLLLGLGLGGLLLGSLGWALMQKRAEDGPPSVFDLPNVLVQQAAIHQQVAGMLGDGKYAEAEELLKQAIKRVPHDQVAHYNLGCVLARQKKPDEAFEHLTEAVKLGWRDKLHLEKDADLESLREDPRFKELLKSAEAPPPEESAGWKFSVTPAEPEDGEAVVTESATGFDTNLGVFRVFFKFPEPNPDLPIAKNFGEAGELLLAWSKDGTAAGHHGDLYDNHDSDHSNMDYAAFPQLTRIEFSDAAKKRGLHHGLQQGFLYNAVTIGNSSTAIVNGPQWRSQPRYALMRPRGPQLAAIQYFSNHLYFYPEHRDHDAGHNGADGGGFGDVYPANTPYMIISQGSSGSDRVFMNAVAATLAAFRPEVKAKLKQTGLLMPAVQMIFRRSNKQVSKEEDYLTGKAHPSVFDGEQLDVVRMVKMAHAIETDSLPPLCRIEVLEEDEGVLGKDYFDVVPREKLFDTPCAIARVMKSSKYHKRMVLSAGKSVDALGKPLKFHWKVLRGDAERIQIKPLDETGSKVELIVPYHARRPIAGGDVMESNRVDIGAFAHNGDYYSAPAFVSLLTLDNEQRIYDENQRIQSVDYRAESVKDNYVDPVLDFPKDWRDEYHFDEKGNLSGWTRIRDDSRQEFTPEGELILEADQGRPTKIARVRYAVTQQPGYKFLLKQEIVE